MAALAAAGEGNQTEVGAAQTRAANATSTTGRRMPSATLTASDKWLNLAEGKNAVSFTFATDPPTEGIPVCIEVSQDFIHWYALRCGTTGPDGTLKAEFKFNGPNTIYYRAIWVWENHTLREDGHGVSVTAYSASVLSER